MELRRITVAAVRNFRLIGDTIDIAHFGNTLVPAGVHADFTDFSSYQFSAFTSAAVPEPTSLALVGLGAVGFGCYHRRKQKKLKLKQAA